MTSTYVVRFLNMDTPETYQSIKNELDENQKYHGDLATEYMKELLEVGDEVEVLVGPEATDQYGRLIYLQHFKLVIERQKNISVYV